MPESSTCCANPGQASYILLNPYIDEEDKYQSLPVKNVLRATWNTLDEVCHHGAEVSPCILEDFSIFVVLSFQVHPRQIHVLQEQSTHGEAVALQSSVCASPPHGEKGILKRFIIKCQHANPGQPLIL